MAESSSSRPSQQFIEWLEKKLKSLQPGNQLPTGKDLARQWGLSESTVRNILRRYQKMEKLVLIPGKGTFIPRQADESQFPEQTAQSSIQSIVDFVVDLISQGELKIGEALPSIKFLSIQFKVAPMTVVRAYRQLKERGLTTRVGKTFWVGNHDELLRTGTGKSAYFFNSSLDFTETFRSGWMAPAYNRFERELLRYGYSFKYEQLDSFPELAHTWMRTKNIPSTVVFYKLAQDELEDIYKPLERLVDKLNDMPVLIDWESGDFRKIPRRRNVKILSRGNIFTTRAKTVTDFIIQKHYKDVLFYFDEYSSPFSMFLPFVRIRAELEAVGREADFKVVIRAKSKPGERQAFFDRLHAHRSKEQIGTVLSKYHPVAAGEFEKEIVFVNTLKECVASARKHSLILFINDDTALEAREVLEKSGRKAGADVAMLSFENNPRFFHEGISCCVPDWEQAGYLMAHSIIEDFSIAKTGKGFIRANAYILERNTT